MGSFDVPLDDERSQLDAFVEEYRSALELALDGLTEEQARRRLVSSATTTLGLLKHVTWMQRVWFEECVGGTSRQALGLVQSPEESFRPANDDTVASVTAAHRQACATARVAGRRPAAERRRDRTPGRAACAALGVPASPARAGPPLRARRHTARAGACWLTSETTPSGILRFAQ
jgi:Protein of unknown function (DUF664)